TFSRPGASIEQNQQKGPEKRGTEFGKSTDRLSGKGSGAVLPAGVQLPEKQGRGLGRGTDRRLQGTGKTEGAERPGGPPRMVLSHPGPRVYGRAAQAQAGDADPAGG